VVSWARPCEARARLCVRRGTPALCLCDRSCMQMACGGIFIAKKWQRRQRVKIKREVNKHLKSRRCAIHSFVAPIVIDVNFELLYFRYLTSIRAQFLSRISLPKHFDCNCLFSSLFIFIQF
jgi:hypothetical protein